PTRGTGMSTHAPLPPAPTAAIRAHLDGLYGPDRGGAVFNRFSRALTRFRDQHPHLQATHPRNRFSHTDAILITYGDQVQAPPHPPLHVLAQTLTRHLKGVVSGVHLLPFYPYSSDDGFSVIDYTAVNPALGSWGDLQSLRANFRLMFDAVINHISTRSRWFQEFLRGNPRYADYFIVESPATDLSAVTRPRTHPLLTPVQTAGGPRHVWTTFSPDQVDLNYKNPAVLLDVINILLFYVSQGAEFIRLDAVGYLWKEVGTSCIHLPQTHRVIQLLRAVLDAVAPGVSLVTETNVPHAENIAYFGDGSNEAQLVYNFSLPPLILHTLHTGDARALQNWAATLTTPGSRATYFNFIASHDGIGIMPAHGILTPAQIQTLVDKTLAHGGLVSHKTNPDGSRSVYELNITLFDALSNPRRPEPQPLRVGRFMVSQAVMLALAGVPGIYIHSLVGSANNRAGVARTGLARTINRQKWQQAELEAALANPASTAGRVFRRYRRLLRARMARAPFHPNGGQEVIAASPAVFALRRTSPAGNEQVLCLHNMSARPQTFPGPASFLPPAARLTDLLSGRTLRGTRPLRLAPYQVRWLAPSPALRPDS
ncbi:MAG: sugar phosphorylase, partial [Anaerolineae bacterium]